MNPLLFEIKTMGGDVAVDLNASFFVQLAIVLILLVVLRKLIFQPFLKSIDLRDEHTLNRAHAAELLEVESDELEEQLRRRLESARAQIHEERHRTRAESHARREALIEETRRITSEEVKRARQDTQTRLESARATLLADARAFAEAIIAQLLGRRP